MFTLTMIAYYIGVAVGLWGGWYYSKHQHSKHGWNHNPKNKGGIKQ